MRTAQPQLTLAEALDRLLQCGVAVQGNVAVGLAGVELLFLDLRVLLASVDTLWPEGMPKELMGIGGPKPPQPSGAPAPVTAPRAESAGRAEATVHPLRQAMPEPSLEATPAKGLVRLVLTLVKLLHDVMERQALCRMEHDRLSPAEIEAVGLALCAQADEIERLRRLFGFSDRDLALDLGVFDGAV